MRLKSFTFGVGTGLLLACTIFYFVYGVQKNSWNNEMLALADTMETDFGTVTSESETQSEVGTIYETETPMPTETTTPTVLSTEESSTLETEQPTEDIESKDIESEDIESTGSTGSTRIEGEESGNEESENEINETEKPSESPTPTENTEITPSPSPPERVEISVVIPSGSYAIDVARILYSNGIIDNSEAFVQYLVDRVLTKRIKSGTYTMYVGIEFDDIAALIIR